ncbi:MAG: S8 family serine peptidase [Pyrinomonadaceae bacterium]
MSKTILVPKVTREPDTVAGLRACPVCGRASDEELIALASLDENMQMIVASNAPPGQLIAEACPTCVQMFERARAQLKSDLPVFEQRGGVLPTPLRLDTDSRFTGRGVTIAFLDSGFYRHPDLTTPHNRILAYHNSAPDDTSTLECTDPASWHGMMTSVVAAGNGHLSNGFYRSIAPEANVVLVKLARTGRVSEADIKRGLDWVLKHHEEYGIRVVNISAGGDEESSYLHNSLSKTVERAVKEGLVVVCAVGNAGHEPGHRVLPPASAPSCIAVGGLDDQNSLDRARRGMYRSSYGPTCDGLQKPEIIAPGIWVPAPILPHTPTAAEAELYATLDRASDHELRQIIEDHLEVDHDLAEAHDLPTHMLRHLITIKLREGDVISEHYKYVDGTSFAAPIVSSIVACMIEANPRLSPQMIKRVLIDTSERLPGIEIDRQGWGVVTPRRAVERALSLRG